MPPPEKFNFERSRGIVWVCDLVDSSKYLNSNETADELEAFLPRLYWVASVIVEAAGGKFIKWTGDGFLAWFETPLHRMLGEKAAAVFTAAFQLTLLVNVTQLGLEPKRKFKIRHGVSYEQDALLINIKSKRGPSSLDLIGRAVVLAFRLSGIPAKFPGIVTQKDLVAASAEYRKAPRSFRFVRWQASAQNKLKFFKGERWGTEGIYVTSEKPLKSKSASVLLKQTKEAINSVEGVQDESDRSLNFSLRFTELMREGPDWAHATLDEYTRFAQENLLGTLKKLVPILEEAKRKDGKRRY